MAWRKQGEDVEGCNFSKGHREDWLMAHEDRFLGTRLRLIISLRVNSEEKEMGTEVQPTWAPGHWTVPPNGFVDGWPFCTAWVLLRAGAGPSSPVFLELSKWLSLDILHH